MMEKGVMTESFLCRRGPLSSFDPTGIATGQTPTYSPELRTQLCQFRTGSLQSVFKIALAQSKITKKGSIHSLRHSYATHLLEKGVPIRVIQKILGHKSVRTTQIYTHLAEETVDSIYPTIDALMADL